MVRALTALRELWFFRSTIILIATPILLCLILPFYEEMGLSHTAGNCLYMLLLMAVYWCTETVHLAVTSLLPLVLAPLLSIEKADVVSRYYFKDLNVMFMGGLIVAVVIEHSQLHRRIALTILRLVGTNPRFLMLGFMLPSWFLSMWISNTATTAMMLAIVQAVISQLKNDDLEMVELDNISSRDTSGQVNTAYNKDIDEHDESVDKETTRKLSMSVSEEDTEVSSIEINEKWARTAKALSLCVCYAATCGGIATLTGTAPNVILGENVKTASEELGIEFGVDFATWMGFGLPVSFVMALIAWLWLQIVFVGCRGVNQTPEERNLIRSVILNEYNKLGSIKWKEVVALVNFVLLALLWITKSPGGVNGWSSLFPKKYVTDATAAMFVATLCFMWPSERPDFCCWRGGCGNAEGHRIGPREGLVTWPVVAQKLPWGLILLLGGGFALAECLTVSGLSDAIGNALNFFDGWSVWAIVMCLSAITAGITEVTSNTAIATIFLPIVKGIAVKNGLHPLYLMLPVAVSASFAFMLPVATPPNALVFATGVLKITDMAKTGFVLNVVGVCITTLATISYGAAMFDLNSFNYTQAAVDSINATAEAVGVNLM